MILVDLKTIETYASRKGSMNFFIFYKRVHIIMNAFIETFIVASKCNGPTGALPPFAIRDVGDLFFVGAAKPGVR